MKIANYKKLAAGLVLASLLVSAVPQVSLAQTNNNRPAASFCALIVNLSDQIISRLTERDGRLASRVSRRNIDLVADRTDRDAKLAEQRADWDSRRQKLYARLS